MSGISSRSDSRTPTPQFLFCRPSYPTGTGKGPDDGRVVAAETGETKMTWTTDGKAFETAYDHLIVKYRDDDGWTVCKGNFHPLESFGTGAIAKQRAVGHAHGLADVVTVEDN